MFESLHPANEKSAPPTRDMVADAPFERVEGDINRGLIILCDHAGNKIPDHFHNLGLADEQLSRHIAYDIGAGDVARNLAKSLGVPALLSKYSRLLIDINRGPDDPTLIMRLSDGAVIPGNRNLSKSEAEERRAYYYTPYHDEITRLLDAGIANGKPPAILSIHSFTPLWKDVPRPWHATILWDKDPRLPRPILKALRACEGIVTDDNVPYSGELKGDCMNRHGTNRGLAHALIEIRQDLISTPEGVAEWTQRLHEIMQGIIKQGGINEIRFFKTKSEI